MRLVVRVEIWETWTGNAEESERKLLGRGAGTLDTLVYSSRTNERPLNMEESHSEIGNGVANFTAL